MIQHTTIRFHKLLGERRHITIVCQLLLRVSPESNIPTFPTSLCTKYKPRSPRSLHLLPLGPIADAPQNEQHTRGISIARALTIRPYPGRYLQDLVSSCLPSWVDALQEATETAGTHVS